MTPDFPSTPEDTAVLDLPIGVGSIVRYFLPGGESALFGQVREVRPDGQLRLMAWNGGQRWAWSKDAQIVLAALAVPADVKALMKRLQVGEHRRAGLVS